MFRRKSCKNSSQTHSHSHQQHTYIKYVIISNFVYLIFRIVSWLKVNLRSLAVAFITWFSCCYVCAVRCSVVRMNVQFKTMFDYFKNLNFPLFPLLHSDYRMLCVNNKKPVHSKGKWHQCGVSRHFTFLFFTAKNRFESIYSTILNTFHMNE